METTIKQLVKDAVLEALTEFANQGIALALNAEPTTDQSTDNKKETGKGGASEESSGGGLNNGRPKPNVGVGTFGLR